MNELQREIIAEARTWLGTPFHHQGRVKGAGVDCIGLIIGVARKMGFQPQYVDRADYPRSPDGSMESQMADVLIRVPRESRQPGDIIYMAWTRIPQHVGIWTGHSVIHAYGTDGHGGVVETSLSQAHLKRVRAVFRFPEVMQWQP